MHWHEIQIAHPYMHPTTAILGATAGRSHLLQQIPSPGGPRQHSHICVTSASGTIGIGSGGGEMPASHTGMVARTPSADPALLLLLGWGDICNGAYRGTCQCPLAGGCVEQGGVSHRVSISGGGSSSSSSADSPPVHFSSDILANTPRVAPDSAAVSLSWSSTASCAVAGAAPAAVAAPPRLTCISAHALPDAHRPWRKKATHRVPVREAPFGSRHDTEHSAHRRSFRPFRVAMSIHELCLHGGGKGSGGAGDATGMLFAVRIAGT